MVKKYVRFLAAVSLAASVSIIAAGCSQKTVRTDEGTETATAEQVASQSETAKQPTDRMPVQPIGTEEPLDSPPMQTSSLAILEGRTTGPMLPVYFDFDQSNIKADQRDRIEDNAKYLKSNAAVKVVIEGNCDERGTNEYNMALGERRAISAKKYLVNLGVSTARMNTISYGEERPLNHGHDELAWSQNRRDDFVELR